MRTNIVINDELMRVTLPVTGLKTKRETVEEGLRTLVRLRKQAEIRKFRGKLQWKGDLDAMRRDS
jgi:Arc/MetJ family transcription regulator